MSDISNSRLHETNFCDPIRAEDLVVEKSLFNTLYRSFGLGDDIFISHSRADGIDYSRSLAHLLQEKFRLKCFADFYWTESGEKLPPFLVKKLKRSTVLVVVMSEGADKRSHNIKEEIKIFQKTGRPILIVDLDNKYNKDNWTELCGISVIKEFPKEQITPDKKIEPSPAILESISDSFNYKTKYDQQRRSARTALVLLILSLFSVIGATVYTSKVIAQAEAATKEKNFAIEEKNKAQTERESAVQEKNLVNGDLSVIQGKLDDAQNDLNATQTSLKTKEADLIITKSNLTQTLEEKQTAESETQIAKSETQIAREKEKKARKNIKSLDVRAMGSQASLLAARDQKFAALELATEAVDKELALNNNSFDNLSPEVQKGLTDSVIRMDFARPLKNDLGDIIYTEISGDGKLIFGNIQDKEDKKKLWRVMWETARPDKYYLLKEDTREFSFPGSIKDVAFSRDGKWLFVPYSHTIEVWKIDLEGGNYKFILLDDPIALTEKEWIIQIASNTDGAQLAILINWDPGRIKIINRKDDSFSVGDELLLPYRIERAAFSPQGELIIDNTEDKRHFYNFTKKEFILKNELKFKNHNYDLTDITDFGDFLLRRQRYGLNVDDLIPEYILISSLDGSIKQSWSNYYLDYKSQFSIIQSLKVINRNSIKIGDVNGELSVIGYSPSPNSFVYDFKEIDLSSTGSSLSFYLLKDKNMMGISNDVDAGLINRQTGRWSRIDNLPPAGTFNDYIWFEKTDKYFYFAFIGRDGKNTANLQIRNLRENKTVRCELDEHFQREDVSLLYDKYPAIITKGNSNDFFLSIYDPDDCRKNVRIKLEIPEDRLKDILSKTHADYLYIRNWHMDKNNVLKGVLQRNQEKENNSKEDSARGNYFLITCDLNKIELLHNPAIEKEVKLPTNIYEIPLSETGYHEILLVNDNSKTTIWVGSFTDRSFLFEFENDKWSKRTLEYVSGQTNFFRRFIFSSSGDSVAVTNGLTVGIWDIGTGKRKVSLTIPEDIRQGEQVISDNLYSSSSEDYVLQRTQRFVFSPDGKSIGVVTKDKQIKFYPISIEEYYYLAKDLLK